jgi:hypothetical protein
LACAAVIANCHWRWRNLVPAVEVGRRLVTPHSRLDLAREILGIMIHPDDGDARRRRQSAFAETLLGMSDEDDEPEAIRQAWKWFSEAGSFTVASQAYPYHDQQAAALKQVSGILVVGALLTLIWMMDANHRNELPGGASLNKAIPLYIEYPLFFPMAARALRGQWSRYKKVAHFCAAFAMRYDAARTKGPSGLDQYMVRAYHENLDDTLQVAAAFQRFGTTFIPRTAERPLMDPEDVWLLTGIEPDTEVPPPLPPDMLASARRYRAPINSAFR